MVTGRGSEHVSCEEAYALLSACVDSLPRRVETRPIQEARSRILAEDIVALRNVPHFNASAVDGYAVLADATSGASAARPAVIERADEASGGFAWVNTGAELPPKTNAVVMVEDTEFASDVLKVVKPLTPGANVRPVGEDVMAGQILARRGDRVQPALISLLLCAGISEVPVVAYPKTLYIPTGDEVIGRDQWLANPTPRGGTVAESNSLYVEAVFSQWGFPVDVHPVIPDDPALLEERLAAASHEYDIVLVGAGSAKGRRDHTGEVFAKLGEMLFRWVRMKPGRPAMAAKARDSRALFVCLPGFPMSTVVVLWSLVYPILCRYAGRAVSQEEATREAFGRTGTLEAKWLVSHTSSAGMKEWLRMQTAQVGDVLYAWNLASGASVLWALSEADGIALLEEKDFECEAGTPVRVEMIRTVDIARRALFQGSDDPAISHLVSPTRRRGADLVLKSVGSMGGLAALSRGACHIAAAHLLDPRDGSYNDSYIERFRGERTWVRRLVFHRMQGMIVARGNPKGIATIRDLARPDVVFANRQPGAGTRVLLDYLIGVEQIVPEEIEGYAVQCTTHLEAANRVASHISDVTLGIKSAADALALEFIPLAEEPYELVADARYLSHSGVAALFECLDDPQWRALVERMGGYRWPD